MATSLSIMITMMVGMIIYSVQNVSADIDIRTRGSDTIVRVMNDLGREVSQGGKIAAMTDTSLTIQVPVDADLGGDVFDESGNIQWGANGQEGWSYVHSWIQTGSFVEGDEGVDLNEDGDVSDSFLTGDLVVAVHDETGDEKQSWTIAGNSAILQSPAGSPDPVPPIFFAPAADSVEITVTMYLIGGRPSDPQPRLYQARRFLTVR